jgi:hypothetical protein
MGREKADEDGDDDDDDDDEGEDEDEDEDEDEEKDAPIMRFGPPKGRVKTVTHRDHQDAASIDGIFLFLLPLIYFYSFYFRYRSF